MTSTIGRGEEEEDILHNRLMKLRSLVGKLRETAGTWYFLRERDWFTGELVDWSELDTDLILVDLGTGGIAGESSGV